jgi:hypothetical protein
MPRPLSLDADIPALFRSLGSARIVAQTLGCSVTYVYRQLRRQGVSLPRPGGKPGRTWTTTYRRPARGEEHGVRVPCPHGIPTSSVDPSPRPCAMGSDCDRGACERRERVALGGEVGVVGRA